MDMAPASLPASYDFGLTPDADARARALHAKAIVFDFLSQRAGPPIFDHYPPELRAELEALIAQPGTIYEKYYRAYDWPYDLSLEGRSDLIFDWYREGGVSVVGFSAPFGEDPTGRIASDPHARLPWLRRVTTAGEIRRAKADGVIAAYANHQPMASIPNDLSVIDNAYAHGLRSLMLTYNSMTTVGVGCTERVDAGLSRHGLDVVRRCNELGIIVDLSHCGRETTLDGCRHSRSPVTANHTAARGVYPHARGKDDECLRAIAGTGGVIGVVVVPAFITDAAAPTIDHFLDHVEYIADLVGWRHVGIGTDWPLQAPVELQKPILSPDNKDTAFREEDRLDVTVCLDGYADVRDLPNITRGLVRRGWDDEAILGVLGENALRVFGAVCG